MNIASMLNEYKYEHRRALNDRLLAYRRRLLKIIITTCLILTPVIGLFLSWLYGILETPSVFVVIGKDGAYLIACALMLFIVDPEKETAS